VPTATNGTNAVGVVDEVAFMPRDKIPRTPYKK
jgi:hypothetical protein